MTFLHDRDFSANSFFGSAKHGTRRIAQGIGKDFVMFLNAIDSFDSLESSHSAESEKEFPRKFTANVQKKRVLSCGTILRIYDFRILETYDEFTSCVISASTNATVHATTDTFEDLVLIDAPNTDLPVRSDDRVLGFFDDMQRRTIRGLCHLCKERLHVLVLPERVEKPQGRGQVAQGQEKKGCEVCEE